MTEPSATGLPTDEELERAQPSGRDEIMEAIVVAATELFAERGPARVTVRDIASRAGVPHSVVFRYFGDKQNVLLEVLRRGSEREREIMEDETIDSPGARFQAEMSNRSYRIAVVQAMLEGLGPEEIPGGMPEIKRTLELVERTAGSHQPAEPHFDPKVVTAFVAAATVGWDVTESFYMDALGIPESDLDEVRTQIGQMLATLVGHAAL